MPEYGLLFFLVIPVRLVGKSRPAVYAVYEKRVILGRYSVAMPITIVIDCRGNQGKSVHFLDDLFGDPVDLGP
jgi:hypothetical protein